ncbi:Kinesin-like protein KIN-13B [Dionaea muscipula]
MNGNGMRKQVQRSSAAASVHQQRHFVDPSSNLLQSDNLLQGYEGFSGGGAAAGFGLKWNRNLHKIPNPGTDVPLDPSMLPDFPQSCSFQKVGGEEDYVSPNVYSPGLLDIHSLDTELLPELPVRSLYDGPSICHAIHGNSLHDVEAYLPTNKGADKPHGFSENNLLRDLATDNDRENSVPKIKVVVRKRPLNAKEISRKENDIITIEPNSTSLTVHETKLKVDLTEYVEKHEFGFDATLDEHISNDEVYAETVEPIIPLIFQRTKATCFAYGQTGSGKTYTMQPLPLRASQDILQLVRHSYRSQGLQLFVSFFEIYGGKFFDLLNDRRNLFIREDCKKQVCIVGLQEFEVLDAETIKDLIGKGNSRRSTGTTGANEESSRSHAVLQLVIKRPADGNESKPPRVVGKLSFIDLAGSERGADTTNNDKQTRTEGAEINKSLLALKECIRALDNDQNHIPFRGSKLTEVLRDSFVGNSRTVMISCISPSSGSCEHTLNTLRYADRVKSLSKRSNSKRDQPSSASDLRDSDAQMNFEDNINDIANSRNRFGWSGEIERAFLNVDSDPNGRAECSSASLDEKDCRSDKAQGTFDYSEDVFERVKQSSRKNKKIESYATVGAGDGNEKSDLQTKKEIKASDFNTRTFSPNDDLNSLLKEEEDLVIAHRKQVEDTMNIVREEMDLLVEADQPGNQLDDYIFKLNSILSQKAAGILKLQKQLAHFKKLLNEQNVLGSSCG